MRYWIVFVFLILNNYSYCGHQEDVQAYISKYSKLAKKEMRRNGIPASITLAQGLLESGYGKSELARKAKNHFGIKCTSNWKGRTYYIDDDKPNECFRKYSSVKKSYLDHSAFLHRDRYQSLFKLNIKDYEAWAYGLKRCAYASNPKYPELLISLIKKYNLNKFDTKKYKK